MFRILVGTIVFAAIAMNLMRAFEIQKWLVSGCLLVLAIGLYLLSTILVQYFIKKRAPEFANDQMWELTAGSGIVPKWVSSIGLLSVSAAIAAILPWVVAILKAIF
ncbi:MAG TPA: hypothetical protein VGO73_03765 [Pyrinomonadaceae bacterium]|jgi:hypothetical protein|nr:hypothetical protein [Pyrinomonadaceae bacterium]